MTELTLDTRGRGRTITLYAVGFALGAITLLWAWNTIAVDLFGAPTVGFRHAVAFELTVCVVAGLLAAVCRLGRQPHAGA